MVVRASRESISPARAAGPSSSSAPPAEIVVGTEAADPAGNMRPQVFADSPDLKRHLGTPWLERFLSERVVGWIASEASEDPRSGASREFSVNDAVLRLHSLLIGQSGFGKTQLMVYLLMRQILQFGASACVVEAKAETVRHVVSLLLSAGFPAESVSVVTASGPTAALNPFDCGLPIAQAASDFVAVLRALFASWGPRLEAVLTAACLVIAGHRLSVFELHRFLTDEHYQAALLEIEPVTDDPEAYAEAKRYFTVEVRSWPKASRAESVQAISNKVAEVVRNRAVTAVLCPEATTLDLAGLWLRGPRVVIVHVDRAGTGESGTGFGDAGANLVAGILSSLLFRTALRIGTGAATPVCFACDELFTLQKFLPAGLLPELLSIARSYLLRLLCCTQSLSMLEKDLLAGLLTNTAFRATFRASYEDASLVAASHTVGTGERLRSVTLGRARGTSLHDVFLCDRHGRALKASPQSWEALRWAGLCRPGGTLAALAASAARSGIGPLHAPDGAGNPVPLKNTLARLLPGEWALAGPMPLRLAVAMPEPRVATTDRETEAERKAALANTLQRLPVQHALMYAAGREPIVVRVADVPPPLTAGHPELAAYAAKIAAATGVTAEEAAATRSRRSGEVDRIASGASTGLHVEGQPRGTVTRQDARARGAAVTRIAGRSEADDGSIA